VAKIFIEFFFLFFLRPPVLRRKGVIECMDIEEVGVFKAQVSSRFLRVEKCEKPNNDGVYYGLTV